MSLLDGLNAQQREAVIATEGPVLILAGAGSGKTRVIAFRIAHLVGECSVPSDAILAVTFTNKAAREMRSRVESLLGSSLRSWISTFHSFCLQLLRRDATAAGLSREFSVYDGADQLTAVREVLRQLNIEDHQFMTPRRVLARISAAKNSGIADGVLYGAVSIEALVDTYNQVLARAGALDFDDLLLRAVALLAQNQVVRERWQRRFRYVLVDEYQDTNRTQYRLVRLLSGQAGNLTVVGDEDQSIYSWRGANLGNLLDFERDFPGARVLRLEANYRSTQPILDAASGLVAHNRRRFGKTLTTVKPGGRPVRLFQASDQNAEASFVATQVAASRNAGRVAVLYRTNAQSRLFEEAFQQMRIPFVVVGGVGFYERAEIKDLLAYLRLVVHPNDDAAFKRILNVPPRGIGDRTVAEIEALASEAHGDLWEALKHVVDDDRLSTRARVALQGFRSLIEGLRRELAGLGPAQSIKRILDASGYISFLDRQGTLESRSRLENVAELVQAAADYEAREEASSTAGFLDTASLLADIDVVRDDAPVVLMTLHSAKGLEFEQVFLAGLEEGLIPHLLSAKNADAIEEERRLCYVGMTRAMESLTLSWAASRQFYGQRRSTQPSRFLSEIPRDCLTVVGAVDGTTVGQVGTVQPSSSRAAPPSSAVPALRPGSRVRHPQFGVGTVLRCEGAGDDLKLTVSFVGIGAKRLLARYASLSLV